MKTRHIILGLGLMGAALTAVVGAIGWGALDRVGAAVERSTVANNATQEATLGDMMHEGLRGDVYAALYHAQRGQADGVASAQKEAQAHGQAFVARVAALRALALPADQAQAAAALAPIVQRYADMGMALTRQAGGDPEGAQRALAAFDALFEELATVQDALIQRIEAHQRETQAQAVTTQGLASRAMLLAALLGTVALSALAMAVARHLMRTLGGEPTEVRRLLHRVADGDLSMRVPVRSGDERSVMAGIGDMVAHLRGTVQAVRDNAAGLSGAAQEVSAGSGDLAHRTSAQAAALDASVASLGEMNALVGQSAGHATQASALVREASGVAQRSGEAVQAVVQTMQGIEQSSRRISEIIGVIDGIAFQTNILALNAAVEAARAGEQGRGFAVVAGEVRALAQRSASAAQEIKALIEDSVRQVGQGSEHVAAAGDTMQRLVQSVASVAALVDEVAGATQQQSQGLGHFAATVRELEGMTQQNAALVEQSAAAAGSLGEQAQRLHGAVGRFKVEA